MNKFSFVAFFTLFAATVGGLAADAGPPRVATKRSVPLIWCSLGTSITWYNDHVAPSFTKGYQTRVMEKIKFAGFVNRGVNAGCVSSAIGGVVSAGLYTIEHGVNDWGNCVKPGTLADYENDTGAGTFAGGYRKVIDAIRDVNPEARIILCTPRKAYGFGNYLPATCDGRKEGGHTLKDYVEIVRAIAEKEGFVVADFHANCGEQDELASLSIDKALHPNDAGYQKMADELVKAILKLFPDAEEVEVGPVAFDRNRPAKPVTFEENLTAAPQVVLLGADVARIKVDSAMMCGAWIPGSPFESTVHFVRHDPKTRKTTCQIQVRPPDNCTRCVGVELAQEGRHVSAKILWARYSWDGPVGTDFEEPGYSGTAPIATSPGAIGYGISAITFSPTASSGR
ncbi:MAG: SGNH/GDSL hydrolase family protein [Kiritimatiellia bacterium]|jgi:lysophospholipase L1-like esterase